MTRNRDPMKPCPVMEAFQNYREALECGQHDQAVAELATLEGWLQAPRWRPAKDQADDLAEAWPLEPRRKRA
jgi:hypothetical protein